MRWKAGQRTWVNLGLGVCLGMLGAVGVVLGQEERTFTLNNVEVRLADVSSEADVYFRSMRLNRALDVWNVEVTVSNKVGRVISGPLVLLIDGFTNTSGPQGTDGTVDAGKGFCDLSALASQGLWLRAR